jgi:hypothetical protein
MSILVAVAVIGGVLLLGFLAVWGLSWGIDKAIKDYIDYARKEKDDDSD